MWDEFVQAQRDVQAAYLEVVYATFNKGDTRTTMKKFKDATDRAATLGVTLLNHLGNSEGLREWLEYKDSQHLLDSAKVNTMFYQIKTKQPGNNYWSILYEAAGVPLAYADESVAEAKAAEMQANNSEGWEFKVFPME